VFLITGKLEGPVTAQFAGKFYHRDQAEAAAAGLYAWAAAAGRSADLDFTIGAWIDGTATPYTLPVGCLVSFAVPSAAAPSPASLPRGNDQ